MPRPPPPPSPSPPETRAVKHCENEPRSCAFSCDLRRIHGPTGSTPGIVEFSYPRPLSGLLALATCPGRDGSPDAPDCCTLVATCPIVIRPRMQATPRRGLHAP